MTGKPDPIALYARVSTEDQDATGQLDRLERWANHHGYQPVLSKIETASGRDDKRPKLATIMEAARARKIKAVAVVKIDRWARSMQHLSKTTDALLAMNISFHAIDQGLHLRPNDPTSKLISRVLGSVAEWEAEIISERTKDSLARLKAQGKKLGRPKRPCFLCRGDRQPGIFANVNGAERALCQECKDLDPAERREILRQREAEP